MRNETNSHRAKRREQNRVMAGFLLLGVLLACTQLAACGGGEDDEPASTPAAPVVSDRPADAMCMWDPRANPVVYECNPGLPLPTTSGASK